jgi:hypothetical protein
MYKTVNGLAAKAMRIPFKALYYKLRVVPFWVPQGAKLDLWLIIRLDDKIMTSDFQITFI